MNLLIIVKKSNIIWDEAIVTVESAKPFALCVKEEKHVRNMIAFDLGASNGRAILGQFDGKRIEMRELHRFENNYIEMNGVYYWDTPYLYSQLKQGLLAFRAGSGSWIPSESTPGAWITACWTKMDTWRAFPGPTAWGCRRISTP